MDEQVLLPLIGIGIIVATVGGAAVWCAVALRRRRVWTQTTGTIIGSQTRVDSTSNAVSGTSRALTIEWAGADGMIRRYTESISITRRTVPVGRTVRLYVDPRHPTRATRALIAPGVLIGVTGAVVGTVFTVISIVATR